MDNRSNNKGTKGNKGGRPSKAEEHKLIEKLTPLADDGYKALESALKDKQGWAVKLFFEYMYGKPKQTIDQNNTHTVNDFNIKDLLKFDKP
jgi:hypothetical protein